MGGAAPDFLLIGHKVFQEESSQEIGILDWRLILIFSLGGRWNVRVVNFRLDRDLRSPRDLLRPLLRGPKVRAKVFLQQ
jgi:hypothetical protein